MVVSDHGSACGNKVQQYLLLLQAPVKSTEWISSRSKASRTHVQVQEVFLRAVEVPLLYLRLAELVLLPTCPCIAPLFVQEDARPSIAFLYFDRFSVVGTQYSVVGTVIKGFFFISWMLSIN